MVKDYYTVNKTVIITDTVLASLTGEDMPNDIMVNMDAPAAHDIRSREVIVEFSSKFQGESTSAQVASGFEMKYEYLNSGKFTQF